MSKIVRFHELGDADVLRIEELPLEEPKAGEVRIDVEAIGLNRAEVMFRRGQYLEEPKLPSGLGYEAAGVISAVGAGVTHVEVGDRVSTLPAFSMTEYGGYGLPAPTSGCLADFNGGTVTDGADLAFLLASWGPCP